MPPKSAACGAKASRRSAIAPSSYQQLTAAAEPAMHDVFSFLVRVQPCTVRSKLVKRNPDDLSRKLENHLQFLAPAVQAKAHLRLPLVDESAALLRTAA